MMSYCLANLNMNHIVHRVHSCKLSCSTGDVSWSD